MMHTFGKHKPIHLTRSDLVGPLLFELRQINQTFGIPTDLSNPVAGELAKQLIQAGAQFGELGRGQRESDLTRVQNHLPTHPGRNNRHFKVRLAAHAADEVYPRVMQKYTMLPRRQRRMGPHQSDRFVGRATIRSDPKLMTSSNTIAMRPSNKVGPHEKAERSV